MFRILLVLDIYDNIVVHAKGGDRKQYQPVHQSSLVCKSSNPLNIIDALRPKEIYIADLNILQGKGPHDINFEMIKEVSSRAKTMLDPGISRPEEIPQGLSLADSVVLGTETASMKTIEKAASLYPGKINVSIDKKNGKVLTKDPYMPDDPIRIVDALNQLDIKDIIILDLDRVGTSVGVDTEFLGKLARLSKHEVLLGGGVKDMDDIETLEDIGIKGALIATALHNGKIPFTMLQ